MPLNAKSAGTTYPKVFVSKLTEKMSDSCVGVVVFVHVEVVGNVLSGHEVGFAGRCSNTALVSGMFEVLPVEVTQIIKKKISCPNSIVPTLDVYHMLSTRNISAKIQVSYAVYSVGFEVDNI